MRGQTWTCAIVVAMLCAAAWATSVAAEDAELREAIADGTEFLKSRQDEASGTWKEWKHMPGGVTALATLALLESGTPADDPAVRKSLEHLRGLWPDTTYVVSLQTMVLAGAGAKKDRERIQHNVQWLEERQLNKGDRAGAWGYREGVGSGDNSNTHFAAMALHDAAAVGAEVQDGTWRRVLDYWVGCQNDDGSWGYYRGMPGMGTMTCAGIASVAAAAQALGDDRQAADTAKKARDRATAWLSKRFTVRTNPGPKRRLWVLYYLHAMKEAGHLTGKEKIGEHDWEKAGRAYLLGQQDSASGFWRSTGHAEDDPVIATSFALLFLAEGRRAESVAAKRR